MRLQTNAVPKIRSTDDIESDCAFFRIAAIADPERSAVRLAAKINYPESTLDIVKPDKTMFEHFERVRPDLLIVNLDVMKSTFVYELTERFETICRDEMLPHLVVIGGNAEYLSPRFGNIYHIEPPFDIMTEGDKVRRFIVQEIVGREYFLIKLRRIAAKTLVSMHIDNSKPGFRFLLEQVMTVLENPYIYFSKQQLQKCISDMFGLSVRRIEQAVHPLIEVALLQMELAELRVGFTEYLSTEREITDIEFIHAAAKLTDISAHKIVEYVNHYQ